MSALLGDLVRIRATSILGWPVWVVNVGDPIDGERPVKMINAEQRGKVFVRREARELLPFVIRVRDDAMIVTATGGPFERCVECGEIKTQTEMMIRQPYCRGCY